MCGAGCSSPPCAPAHPSSSPTRNERIGRAVLVEELALPRDGEEGLTRGTPRDYKCMMLGGELQGVYMVERTRGQDCHTWRDRNWNPLPAPPPGSSHPVCPDNDVPRPEGFDLVVAAAERLGDALGIQQRIDIYLTPSGAVLGEFTRWHQGAKPQKMSPEWRCRFARRWRGTEGAGDPPREIPDVLRGWGEKTLHEQCRLIQGLQRRVLEEVH